jgi:NAD(P)H-dependent flavin oxidoreductase YrpB (nitropropane dioxygenase family)
MPSRTSFTDLVGCRLPLQLVSMGGPIGTPELAAAVSAAGGLGMIPNPSSAGDVELLLSQARELTTEPIGVGFLMPFVVREVVHLAAERADVVEFFYGDPDRELVALAGRHGAVVGWQVGSAGEARRAAEAGCGYVVAQGTEAGGHVRGNHRLREVLAETMVEVSLPVVAAGGVGSAVRAAELLSAGAAAVRVGTRFVAADEADAHPLYVLALVAAGSADTVLTEAFANGWPDAPHRVLRSSLAAAEAFTGDIVATVGGRNLPRFAPVPPTGAAQGEVAAMPMYAGTSVDDVRAKIPAAAIVDELTTSL